MAVVSGDGVALNGRRRTAEGSVKSTDINPAVVVGAEDRVAAAGNGEVRDDTGALFLVRERDGGLSGFVASINDGDGGAGGAGDGDGFAVEINVFVVSAGRDKDGVAVVGRVHAGLDCGLVGGNVNGLLGERRRDEAECEKQPESSVKTAGCREVALARDGKEVWARHRTRMLYRISSEKHGLNVMGTTIAWRR